MQVLSNTKFKIVI